VLRKPTDKRLQQSQGARGLLLAEPGDQLLQLLLGCHNVILAAHAHEQSAGVNQNRVLGTASEEVALYEG